MEKPWLAEPNVKIWEAHGLHCSIKSGAGDPVIHCRGECAFPPFVCIMLVHMVHWKHEQNNQVGAKHHTGSGFRPR